MRTIGGYVFLTGLSVLTICLGCSSHGNSSVEEGHGAGAGGGGAAGSESTEQQAGNAGTSTGGAGGKANTQAAVAIEWTEVKGVDPAVTNRTLGFAWLFATKADTLLGSRDANLSAFYLYRSVDRGRTWTPVTNKGGNQESTRQLDGVPVGISVSPVAQLPSGRIFGYDANYWSSGPRMNTSFEVSTADSGVYISDDDGITWRLSPGLDFNGMVYQIFAIGPKDVVVHTARDEFVSHDEGEHWSSLRLSHAGIRELSVTADRYGSTSVLIANRLFRTRNEGKAWFDVPYTGTPLKMPMYLHALGDGSLLATALGDAPKTPMARSTDYGDSWTAPKNGFPAFALVTRPHGSTLALGRSAFALSSDYGDSWQSLALPPITKKLGEWRAVAQLSDGTVFVSGRLIGTSLDSFAMYTTRDVPDPKVTESAPALKRPETCSDGALNGDEKRIDCGGSCGICEDWSVRMLPALSCMYVTATGTILASTYTTTSVGTTLRSIDGGVTFTDLDTKTKTCDFMEADGQVYALSLNDQFENSIVVYNDTDGTFTPVTDSTLPNYARCFHEDGTGAFWYLLASEIYGSTDSGKTWVNRRTISISDKAELNVDSNGRVFLVDEGKLYRLSATDRFEKTALPAGIPTTTDLRVYVVADAIYLGAGTSIFRSVDSLATAKPLAALPAPLLGVVVDSKGTLIVSTEKGMYESRDDGATWTSRQVGTNPSTANATKVAGIRPSDEVVIYSDNEWNLSVPTTSW